MKRPYPLQWQVQASDHPNTGLLIKPVPGQVVCEVDPGQERHAPLLAAAPDLRVVLNEAREVLQVVDQHPNAAPIRVWELLGRIEALLDTVDQLEIPKRRGG